MLKSKIRQLYYNKQLRKGRLIEMEHTNSIVKAGQIARDHLKENINYYKYVNAKAKNKKEYLITR